LAPDTRLDLRPALALLFLVALLGTLLFRPTPTLAQLVVVDSRFYVTELRADQNKIGISEGRDSKTRTWVDIEPTTRISTSVHRGSYSRAVTLTRHQMFNTLKPGMRIRVNGGRAWDQHIVAKRLWF
jgi:hypothetical protein